MTGAHERWRRDRHSFYNFLALERGAIDGPPELGGLTAALMSKDPATGAHTYVVELPAGWRAEAHATDSSLELFTLAGGVALEGVTVGAGGYVHVAQGCGGGELRSEVGATALLFWNPDAPSFPPPYTQNRVVRLADVPWQDSLPDAHGIMHKSLRLPDPTGDGYDGGPAGYLRVLYIAPGVTAPFEHVHHECFEEIICLQGDCLLADEGLMGLGSVTCHPQEWWHGPFASRSGALVMVHTDAPMGFPWPPRDYPFQQEVVDTYLDEARWDVPAAHTPWVETPWTGFQDDPTFTAWADSPAAAEFGDEVGQGVVSAFRASRRRTQQADEGS